MQGRNRHPRSRFIAKTTALLNTELNTIEESSKQARAMENPRWREAKAVVEKTGPSARLSAFSGFAKVAIVAKAKHHRIEPGRRGLRRHGRRGRRKGWGGGRWEAETRSLLGRDEDANGSALQGNPNARLPCDRHGRPARPLPRRKRSRSHPGCPAAVRALVTCPCSTCWNLDVDLTDGTAWHTAYSNMTTE